MPASPAMICAHLTDRAGEGVSVGTIDMACGAISYMHRRHGLEDTILSEGVRQVRRGLRRLIGAAPRRQARPLQTEDIRTIVTAMDRMVAHRDALVAVIEHIFTRQPAEHWLALLHDAGISAGKVCSMDDVNAWDQVRSQGLVLEVEHPSYGALVLPGSPRRFDEQPFSGGRERHLAPPMLGEHGDTIREWLAEEGT